MATYRITDPRTNKTIKITGDSPPTESELEQIFSSVPSGNGVSRFQQFQKNLAQDVKANVGGLAMATAELGAQFPGPLALMKQAQGIDPQDPERLQRLGRGMFEGIKEVPSQLAETLSHPIRSFEERPLSTGLDIGMLASGGVGLGRAAIAGARGTAQALAPGFFRSVAGIPRRSMTDVLKKPAIFDKPPVPAEEVSRVVGKPVIDALQGVKERIGRSFGSTFRKIAGMEGPVQEFIATPTARRVKFAKKDVPTTTKQTLTEIEPTTGAPIQRTVDVPTTKEAIQVQRGAEFAIPRQVRSESDLLIDKNRISRAFKQGDQQALRQLHNTYNLRPGDTSKLPITNKDKLQMLTRAKRQVQSQISANMERNAFGTELKPIDTSKDAALKQISKDIDKIRTDLPGGQQLARADMIWKEVRDLFNILEKDLANPGTATDTMSKILRGDMTLLTSGRLGNKINAIKRLERGVGKKILQPALEEMSRQVFAQPLGTGFFANVARVVGSLLGMVGAGIGPLNVNIPAAAGAAAFMGASSPRLVRGAIKAGAKTGAVLKKAVPTAKAGIVAGPAAKVSKGVEEETKGKVLTEEKAYEFFKRAVKEHPNDSVKKNRRRARRLAKKEGYTWEGDF